MGKVKINSGLYGVCAKRRLSKSLPQQAKLAFQGKVGRAGNFVAVARPEEVVLFYTIIIVNLFVASMEHDPQQKLSKSFCGMSYEPGKALHQPPWAMRPALRRTGVDRVARDNNIYFFHF